jgi:hypothetical protein
MVMNITDADPAVKPAAGSGALGLAPALYPGALDPRGKALPGRPILLP